ncbi:hypothetical protein [Allorhizobium borbori]|uniref:Uncharacterized protein n=1 Tax=Allorhizobium borbori TaxID=485907 RepID=A0A7W6K4I8_9HYPH|nr:hypothetical protein [Allorhizobium borbori]MBB4104161.1 hypothetical protein [Allorhizobium borbori]
MKHLKLKSGAIFVAALALVVLLIPLAHGRAKTTLPQAVSLFKPKP